jgi:hypothetical protein
VGLSTEHGSPTYVALHTTGGPGRAVRRGLPSLHPLLLQLTAVNALKLLGAEEPRQKQPAPTRGSLVTFDGVPGLAEA